MKNICLNGLNNIAPAELDTHLVPLFYYDVAPTEQKSVLENQIDQLVCQFYGLTEEKIKNY
jgi:hypothetical protein